MLSCKFAMESHQGKAGACPLFPQQLLSFLVDTQMHPFLYLILPQVCLSPGISHQADIYQLLVLDSESIFKNFVINFMNL